MDIQTALDNPNWRPEYATAGAAGSDLKASIAGPEWIGPGDAISIATGVSVAIPDGYVGLICPRSGLAARHQVSVCNAPGVIDSDYRGEIRVLLENRGDCPFVVEHGMRIAQLLIVPVVRAVFREAESLPETERGANGFGSTGHA